MSNYDPRLHGDERRRDTVHTHTIIRHMFHCADCNRSWDSHDVTQERCNGCGRMVRDYERIKIETMRRDI